MNKCASVLEGHIIPGEPLVSISVITYNHEEYIRQCLNSILMQRVDFPYEVLIHDDASPDNTAEIIHEFEAQFPTVIKPIYQTKNQWSQGKLVSKFNFDRAKGKYIAQCDGDDYWTDPYKLQIQVNFLEEHPEYVACVHRFRVLIEDNEEGTDQMFIKSYVPGNFTLKDVEKYYENGGLASQQSTVVARNLFSLTPDWILKNYNSCNTNGDTKYSLFLALNGMIYRFDQVMSVYRFITKYGTSWSATEMMVKLPITRTNRWLSELEKFAKSSYNLELDYSYSRANELVSGTYNLLCSPSKDKITDIINCLKYCNLKSFFAVIYILPKRIVTKIRRIVH